MNIQLVNSEAMKQHHAYKAGRARMRGKPAPPPLSLPEEPLKPIAKINGFKITADQNAHVLLYRIIRKGAKLSVRDVQIFSLFNSWSFNGVETKPNQFKLTELKSSARKADIALVRQVAMYICRELLQKSLPTIGYYFGGRDHTTVLHGHRKVKNMILSRQLLMNGKPFNLDRIGEI
jgi:hypothetical protein